MAGTSTSSNPDIWCSECLVSNSGKTFAGCLEGFLSDAREARKEGRKGCGGVRKFEVRMKEVIDRSAGLLA